MWTRGEEAELDPEEENVLDTLSSADRVVHLEAEFSKVVEEIEAGDESPAVVARAEGVLSELRAQLYATGLDGRAKHRVLEERLESLIGEGKSEDDDVAN